MIDQKIFGEALIRMRGERSQRFIARKAGVPNGTYCQWERGKRAPRDSQIPKILQGLGCTQDELVFAMWKVQAEQFRVQGSELPLLAEPSPPRLRVQLDPGWQKDCEKNLSPQALAALERLQVRIDKLGGDLDLIYADFELILVDFAAFVTALGGGTRKSDASATYR